MSKCCGTCKWWRSFYELFKFDVGKCDNLDCNTFSPEHCNKYEAKDGEKE